MKTYMKVAKYWDEIQSYIIDYDQKAKELNGMFQKNNVKSILELGCGTGILSTNMAKLGYECTGVDIDDDMLACASEKAQKNNLSIAYKNCDMRNLDYNEKFDVVLCFQALSFVTDDIEFQETLSAIYRALKPGGFLSFGVLNKNFELMDGGLEPFSLMDLVISKKDHKIVRFNSSQNEGDIEYWNAVYFIEENGELSMQVMNNKLRYFDRTNVEEMLNKSSFKNVQVNYKNAAKMKNANMLFTAMK